MSVLKSMVKTHRDDSFTFRLSKEERNLIKLKAGIYAGGNMSAWILYCALNHKPRTQDMLEDTPENYSLRAPKNN